MSHFQKCEKLILFSPMESTSHNLIIIITISMLLLLLQCQVGSQVQLLRVGVDGRRGEAARLQPGPGPALTRHRQVSRMSEIFSAANRLIGDVKLERLCKSHKGRAACPLC